MTTGLSGPGTTLVHDFRVSFTEKDPGDAEDSETQNEIFSVFLLTRFL